MVRTFPRLKAQQKPSSLFKIEAKRPSQVALALVATCYISFQVVRNLPDGPLKRVIAPANIEKLMINLGQFQRGWGMFASGTYSTNTLTLVATHRNSEKERIEIVGLHPGYLINPMNEIAQDLIADDNNGGDTYRDQLLRRECQKRKSSGVVRLQLVKTTIGVHNLYNPNQAAIPNDSTTVIADRMCTQ